MIFPLGLGLRWAKVPFLSLGIIFINIIYFHIGGNYSQKHLDEKNTGFLSEDQERIVDKVIVEYCYSINEIELCQDVEDFFSNIERRNDATLLSKWKELSKETKSFIVKTRPAIYQEKQNFSGIESYALYKKEMEKSKNKMDFYIEENNLLSQKYIGPTRLLEAQFSHMNYLHLLINIIIFLVFAPYVESYLSKIQFLSLYLVGGSLGLFIHAFFFLEEMTPLIGASANIAAVLGAFYALFFHKKIKYWIIFRFPKFPVKWAMPITILADEILEMLSTNSSTAHQAHFVGYLIGALFCLPIVFRHRLASSFLYPFEQDVIANWKNLKDLNKIMHSAQDILKFNPKNFFARRSIIKLFYKIYDKKKRLEPGQLEFVSNLLRKEINYLTNKQDFKSILIYVKDAPSVIPSHFVLSHVNQEKLLELAYYSGLEGQYPLALRMYQAYFDRYPNSNILPDLKESVIQLLNKLNDQQHLVVQEMASYGKNKYFESIITKSLENNNLLRA